MQVAHWIGIVALVGGACMWAMERRAARREAQRRANLLRSTEGIIQQVLLQKRHSTRKGA
jgi:hypothetical protein